MLGEQIGERRVIGAVAPVDGELERTVGREQPTDRLHVVAQVHHPHRQRDRLAGDVVGIAVAVPALEREAQRIANAGSEVQPLHQHVGDLAAGREVVHRPFAGGLLDQPDDRVALLGAPPGGRELHHVVHHLGRVGGVVHQRLGPDRDLVAEHGGDLVRVPGAADVAQHRNPVRVLAHLVIDVRGLADPGREQAGPQLGLERLAEGVVLRERQRGDQFTEAK